MNLILKLDVDMVKIYYHAKNEVNMSTHSKVVAQTDTLTNTHTDRYCEKHNPHSYEA